MSEQEQKDKLLAAIEFIHKTGAKTVQVCYSDDEEPVIWFVVAIYDKNNLTLFELTEVAAATSPTRAALHLCERLADGGKCSHCNRPSGFEPDLLLTMPFDKKICWYQYDPELKVFRRGCE